MFADLLGDQFAQRLGARGFAPRLFQVRLLRRQCGLRLAQGQNVTLAIDPEQRLTAFDDLVIDDRQFGDEPGDIRRDLDDIGADAAIRRPGFDLIVDPERASAGAGDGEDAERHQWSDGGGKPGA